MGIFGKLITAVDGLVKDDNVVSQTPPAEPPKPKPEPRVVSSLPFLSKKVDKYNVYLVFWNNVAYHTTIEEHTKDGKNYYVCAHTKKIYTDAGFENGDCLVPGVSNVVLVLEDGSLAFGELEWTPTAHNYIQRRDNHIRKDRAAESATRTQDKKFQGMDGLNIVIAILLICIGVFLVIYFWFGGMPGIINAINQAPAAMNAAKMAGNSTINQTFVVG